MSPGITGYKPTLTNFPTHSVARSLVYITGRMSRPSHTLNIQLTALSSGVLFDLAECLIQRCFAYATGDVRSAYVLIKEALLDPAVEKVVLVLHSQGGIEGGLIIDWLLDELPQDLLHQLEVYTFGNAANHFNNPICSCRSPVETQSSGRDSSTRRSVGYIEHYANREDPVSWLGVLRFVNIPNRYLGRLFIRPGSGHLMNQHYLDNMFTLGSDRKVLKSNPFMDMTVEAKPEINIQSRGAGSGLQGSFGEPLEATLTPMVKSERGVAIDETDHQTLRVKDFSRLWQYRNGGSPERQKTT